MYNEAESLPSFHKDLLLPAIKEAANNSYEIIYVNDGSRDTTLKLLSSIAQKNKRVKVVNLSRNFGKEIAVTAGLSIASGEATIILDGDGQHPPELIKKFLNKWREGAQVVIGVRASNQNEGILKKWGSKLFYKLFNMTSGSEIVPRSTDFRLIDKNVRIEFTRFSERNRITRGLIDWLGFKRDYITFDAAERMAGQASYDTGKLIKLALNSFVSLSLRPLFIFGWIGILITLLSLLVGLAIFIEQFLMGDPLKLDFTGSALLGVFISFLIGLVLTSQGVIAVYLSHVHGQTQDRPLFVIDTKHSSNMHNNESS